MIHFKIFGINFTLEKKKYFPLLFKVWLAMVIILLIAVLFFNYQITSADVPGGIISGALLAYLIHIIKD
jgi:hypothetical protein